MSQPSTQVRPVLTSIAAHLYVSDIEASIGFYTRKLGFSVDFLYGDPPFYGQIRRDSALLALRHVDEPCFVAGAREREDLLSASITLASSAEIEALDVEFRAAGVPFHQSLREEPWGAKTLIVRDPDGNLILFASPAA